MQQPLEPGEGLTVAEAAKKLGVSPTTLRGLIHAQRIRAVRLGRELRLIERDIAAFALGASS